MTGELVLPSGVRVVDRRAAHVIDVEARDPRAATQRIGFTSPVLPQVEEWDGHQAFRLGVMANVIAYRCIQIRANAGAKVPLVAGRRLGDAKTINENAPITRLLGPPPGGPAPKLSARKLLRWTLAQEVATGRRAWEIETDDGTPDGAPVAFWPLVAGELRAVPSKGGSPEWFKVFEYGPAHKPIRLSPDMVFYGWDPSGNDFRQAESALQAARFDLSLVNLCDRYGIGFLRNNAIPAAIITTTRFPDEASKRAFQRHWSNEYQGPDNSGRVAINEVDDVGEGPVGDSIDVKQLGISGKDARLVETRKEAMHEIAIALGVPWSKLDASGRTFDNADAENATFYEETVLEDLIDLQDDINMQLAPRLGDEVVWFDLREIPSLRRRKFAVSSDNVPALLDRGVILTNEVREDCELEPVEWGDEPLAPAPTVPGVGALPAIDPPVTDPDLETTDDERTPREPERRIVDPDVVELRRATIWRAVDATVTNIEARWMRSLRRLFRRQSEATVARLTGKRGRQALGYTVDGERRDDAPTDVDAGALFDVEFWREETGELVDDLYLQAAGAGLDRLALTFGVAFDLEAPWVREFITSRANQLAGQVTQTTYEAIVDELVDGVAAGESIDDLAARIRKVFTAADQVRAERIARTEVISAYNGASIAGAEQLPTDVVAASEWIATRDSRTRDAHAAADGQVVLRGLPFTVAGIAAAYPGDPALPASQTVNCRCTVALLTPEEYLELSERAPRGVEQRVAKSLISLVPSGGEFDLLGLRRALEASAA